MFTVLTMLKVWNHILTFFVHVCAQTASKSKRRERWYTSGDLTSSTTSWGVCCFGFHGLKQTEAASIVWRGGGYHIQYASPVKHSNTKRGNLLLLPRERVWIIHKYSTWNTEVKRTAVSIIWVLSAESCTLNRNQPRQTIAIWDKW